MTAYVSVPAYADHKLHPRVLLLIVAGHAAVIAALMLVKMNLPQRFVPTVTTVRFVDAPKPPPPPSQPQLQPKSQQAQTRSVIDHPQQVVQTRQISELSVDNTPAIPNLTPIEPMPPLPPMPRTQPVRTGPRFATPDSELKPPYPLQKLLAQEETTLKLRLTIDPEGRVIAADPVGSADPVFLAAARKHILAHWRYQPATDDGHPVPSSTVITLRFQLDE